MVKTRLTPSAIHERLTPQRRGRFEEDGYLWFLRPKGEKELIKPGGENIYPAELEKAILQHEKIVEVSVIGVPDKKWGEAIKAVCVLKPGEVLDEQELASA